MGCGPKGTRGPFTVLDATSFANTLTQKLVPCVDKLRDLNTKLGARPYQVALVHTRWTGGSRGEGAEEVLKRELILPTPDVPNIDAIARELQSVGQNEGGTVRVLEISPAYSEECLTGLGSLGEPVPDDQNFYWEITLLRNQRAPLHRRFVLRSPPKLDATNMQWVVSLLRADEDRARNGDPED